VLGRRAQDGAQLRPRLTVEFAIGAGEMRLHRLQSDEQRLPISLFEHPRRGELGHPALACGDHWIVVERVDDLRIAPIKDTLVLFATEYGTLQ
jgi:hypothetical protein